MFNFAQFNHLYKYKNFFLYTQKLLDNKVKTSLLRSLQAQTLPDEAPSR